MEYKLCLWDSCNTRVSTSLQRNAVIELVRQNKNYHNTYLSIWWSLNLLFLERLLHHLNQYMLHQ